MTEKIESAKLLHWDIRDLVSETPTSPTGISETDAISTMETIMDKVTEFVNENYIPKP